MRHHTTVNADGTITIEVVDLQTDTHRLDHDTHTLTTTEYTGDLLIQISTTHLIHALSRALRAKTRRAIVMDGAILARVRSVTTAESTEHRA